MSNTQIVLYGDELLRLESTLSELWRDANARAVFVIDRNGMEMASAGDVAEFDATSLSSLAAGNVAATEGLAKLIGEREFSVLFHEGRQDHIHISVVGGRGILLVIFDDRSSLGLVRLRVRQAAPRIEGLFSSFAARRPKAVVPPPPPPPAVAGASPTPLRAADSAAKSPFSQITDEDIEALFGD